MTKEEFINEAAKVFGEQYDYSNVNGDAIEHDTKVAIKCKKHGLLFWETPHEHLHGFIHCEECYKDKIRGTN